MFLIHSHTHTVWLSVIFFVTAKIRILTI
jgi:hypothetical protein